MNPNWPRWLWASFTTHFATHFEANALPHFVEGDDRPDPSPKDFVEIRMDGPRIWKQPGRYRLYVPVNILIQSTMDDDDTHRIFRTAGVVVEGFADSIGIFKLGNGVEDDQSLSFCMSLMQDKLNPLKVNHFGQIDATLRLQQATVEGHYEGFVTE